MHDTVEVKRGPGRPPKVKMMVETPIDEVLEDAPEPPPTSVISAEMAALLLAMQGQTMAAIAEMKKPSVEEQEKIDAAKERARLNKRAAIEMGERTIRAEKAHQRVCAHSQPDGNTSFRGQVNSDNCYRLYCMNCKYISPPIHATPEQIASGLNLSKIPASKLTIAGLEAAAASPSNLPPDPIPMPGIGGVADNANL